MYQVNYHRRVKKVLLRMSAPDSEKFRQIVEILQTDPHLGKGKTKKLQRPLVGYRYKFPPYRLVYTVDKKRKIVYIYDFFRRGRGYR